MRTLFWALRFFFSSWKNLENAKLENANLEGAILIGAILIGAILTKANLYGVHLTDAKYNTKSFTTLDNVTYKPTEPKNFDFKKTNMIEHIYQDEKWIPVE